MIHLSAKDSWGILEVCGRGVIAALFHKLGIGFKSETVSLMDGMSDLAHGLSL